MNRKLIFLLFILIGVSSCKDYLDVVPDNIATIDKAFSDQNQAYKYLVTCYSYMPSYGQTTSNPAFFSGDEGWLPEATLLDKTVDAWYIARGNQQTGNPYLNYWDGEKGGKNLYDGIRDCNVFMEKIDQARDLEDDLKARWVAEVKFLKAYYHYWLLRMYGPISINRTNVDVDAIGSEMFQSRDKVDDVFNYVVELIDESVHDLPLIIANQLEEVGRITQPIALAMKARILVEAASPLFNGNPDFSSLQNPDGTKLFSQEFDPGKWVKADAACDSAILVAELAGHALFQQEDYVSRYVIHDTLQMNCALRSAVTDPYNKEIIWGCAKSWDADTQHRSFARLGSYVNEVCSSNLAPPLRIAEQFYSDHGVPIEEDSSWDYENRYALKVAKNEDRFFIKEGEETVGLHFNREPRFYSSLGFDRGIWYGSGKYQNDDLQYVRTRFGEPANTYNVTDYSITGYWPKKLVNIETTVNSAQTGLSANRYAFPIMRMADLYLLKAEAANEVNSAPNEKVFAAIDKVRERAGLKGVQESWSTYSTIPAKFATKEGMRQIIQQERLIELAMEGQRYWDVRRWKKAIDLFNQPILGWNLLEIDANAFYQKKLLFIQSYTVRDYFWPIKEYELTINPNLVQNIGW